MAASDGATSQEVCEVIGDLLGKGRQPSAWEIVDEVEKRISLLARWAIPVALAALAEHGDGTWGTRVFCRGLLESPDLEAALGGAQAPRVQIQSTIDELFAQSARYRDSAAFSEMIAFVSRFRDYAPYNLMLIKVQNPSCGYFATQRDWRVRFGRLLKEDARPLLILAPMHPVMLVFDLDQTTGGPLPEELRSFASFRGEWKERSLELLIRNAWEHGRVRVDVGPLSSTHAGFATVVRGEGEAKMRVKIHEGLSPADRFGVLCHELAHIFLGHLGRDPDGWWPGRQALDHGTVEIEAEAVAFIVTSRAGLQGSSAAYVCRHLDAGLVPPSVSFDQIGKVAGRLEGMTDRYLETRQPRRGKTRRNHPGEM